jgi:disulfide bond formation protein DsbB
MMDFLGQRIQRALPGLFGAGLLSFGLGLQVWAGVVPCPMCILQRLVWLAIMAWSVLAVWLRNRLPLRLYAALLGLLCLTGAGVAARQSWLQWFPPQAASCGRDFDGLIETFPLPQALALMFRGSGDCSVVDWTFLGGSIANWSFVCFGLTALYALALWRESSR